MKTFRYVFCLFCATLLTDFVNSKVELITPTRTVSLNEKAYRRFNLIDVASPIRCRDTTDGDKTRAWLGSITPTTPCFGCFTIEPCDKTRHWIYCLVYQPNREGLSYSVVRSYTAVIMCTDDIETPVLSTTVEIRIISNLPPQFEPQALFESIPPVRKTKDLRPGDVIHTVLTNDTENDAVFFDMYTVPSSDLFTIDYGSGVIRAARDMRFLCTDTIAFHVSIWDPYHNPGPRKVFQATFRDSNDKPAFSDTKHTLEVKEDASPGIAVSTAITVVDPTLYPNIQLYLSSLQRGALDMYHITGGRLRVRRDLNYEYEPLREVTVTLRAFDGFCFSDDYTARVVITDVNDDFVLQPIFMEPVVNEGFVNYSPNLTIVDQDVGEVHTFSRVSGNNKLIVQPSSGHITSELIDIDPRKEKKSISITIQVRDTSTSPVHAHSFEVNLTLIDINDNAPVFYKKSYEFKVDNCTEVGKILGKVGAKDDDSPLNGNNYLRFSGSGTNFAVLSDGSVLYTSLLAAGKTNVGTASVTDMGLNPKALAGEPAQVSVVCEVCKVTTTRAPRTTTTTTTTTEWTGPRSADAAEILRATDTSTNKTSWQAQNLGWIAAAASLLGLLIVLVAFMLWRQITCPRPKPRPQKVKGSKQKAAKNSGQKNGQQQKQQQHDSEQESWPQQQTATLQHVPLPAAAAVQQSGPGPSSLQQQSQPRSETMATSGDTVDVPMQPPSLAYPHVFKGNQTKNAKPEKAAPSKNTKPTKPAKQPKDNKPSKDTKQPQDKKPPKDTKPPPEESKPAKDTKPPQDPKPPKESQNPKPPKNTKPTENFKPTLDKKKAGEPTKPGKDKAEESPKTKKEIYHKPQMQVGEYIDLEIVTPRHSPLPAPDRW